LNPRSFKKPVLSPILKKTHRPDPLKRLKGVRSDEEFKNQKAPLDNLSPGLPGDFYFN
jgi:hypothetical protein